MKAAQLWEGNPLEHRLFYLKQSVQPAQIGSGVPAEALEGVYSLMGWYYDMKGFQDAAIVKASDAFAKKFQAEYKYPPDPYSAMAYEGVMEAVRGIELARSLDGKAISKALMASPTFDSMKG